MGVVAPLTAAITGRYGITVRELDKLVEILDLSEKFTSARSQRRPHLAR